MTDHCEGCAVREVEYTTMVGPHAMDLCALCFEIAERQGDHFFRDGGGGT